MQSPQNRGKLVVKDGKVVCPVCKRKTDQTVRLDTKAENFPLWCRRCKNSFVVNIDLGACSVSFERPLK